MMSLTILKIEKYFIKNLNNINCKITFINILMLVLHARVKKNSWKETFRAG